MPALLGIGMLSALSSHPFPGALLGNHRYLHFCKVMSSADNGFSVPGGAGVPDIVPWRRGSGKQIVHPSGIGVLSRPPPSSHSHVYVAEGRPMISGLLVSQPPNDQNCKSLREELIIFFLVQMGI